MAYAALTDMQSRFGEDELVQLTDRHGDGMIDPVALEQALIDASAVIDGYLAGRYPVPLAPVPPILVGYACDLARLRLYKDAPPEIVVRRGDEAIKFLALVGQGKINLGAAPEPASDNTVQVATLDRRRHGIGL